MKKIYAIGDIHGCIDKLTDLMSKINVDLSRDTLVFLGDYIDRGRFSYEVVSYLIQLKKRAENVVFLKGNHEEMLEYYLRGKNKLAYLVNGGQQTIDSYLKQSSKTGKGVIPKEHQTFFQGLELYYETDEYIFVHAGLREKVTLADQTPEDMLWIRSQFIRSSFDFGKRIVFGHTPVPEPLVKPNKIGIDTGAVYGNKLTCVELPDLIFHDA